jgi:hypothetical protein
MSFSVSSWFFDARWVSVDVIFEAVKKEEEISKRVSRNWELRTEN